MEVLEISDPATIWPEPRLSLAAREAKHVPGWPTRARLLSLLLRPTAPPLALGFLVAASLLVAETLLAYPLEQVVPVGSAGMLYLLGVLVVSMGWGFRLGGATALFSAGALDYFHIPPLGTLFVPDSRQLVAVPVFLAVALLVGSITELARSRAVEAGERRLEADLAAELARLMMGAGGLRPALGAASRHLAQALALPSAAIELEAVAGDGRRAAFPLRDGVTVLGTLLVPADLPEPVLRRLRLRVVPSVQALLRAARDREAINASLEASREELRALAEEQAALRRVATLVARGVSPTEVFAAVTVELGRLLGVHATALVRYEPDGTGTVVSASSQRGVRVPAGERCSLEGENVASRVWRTGRAARIASYEDAPGYRAARMRELGIRSGVGAPIVVEGRLWGAAIALSARPEPPPPDIEARMVDFMELVATAIANADSRAELTASRARIVAAADDARRRLERDLHDGTQQRLVSLGLQLRMAEASVPSDMNALKEQLSHTAHGLAGAFEDLREISRGIHPAILSKGGLGPALKTLARRSSVAVLLDVSLDRRLPENAEVAAYYVVSEALTNVAKHARASMVHVGAEAAGANLELSIRDDGVGGADLRKGSGLLGIRDRVEALGGHMEIASPAGVGTSLLVRIPIEAGVIPAACQSG
ncbi:MAG: two-component system sensor kinase [Chloroflexi bacterium]|jgi:signal transduction histidine kinase|nr:two-component system sensor kinase [Chloroflexota bacterium]